MRLLAYLLARFSEPSSYAGLGALLALIGWNLPEVVLGPTVQLLAAACGLLALGLKERAAIGAIVLLLWAAPALSGCTEPPTAVGITGSLGSPYTAAEKLTQATAPNIAGGCAEYQRTKAAAEAVAAVAMPPADRSSRLAAIESFGDNACGAGAAATPGARCRRQIGWAASPASSRR